MKTKVRITSDVQQEQARKGDIGYIDGYVRGADERPYAMVVIQNLISMVPHHQLEVISRLN